MPSSAQVQAGRLAMPRRRRAHLCLSALCAYAWAWTYAATASERGLSVARACQRFDTKQLEMISNRSFLITTSCSNARLESALARLASIPLEPQVRTFERDENGARGCLTSHLSIYREALDRDLPWALIFEDNLKISSTSSSAESIRLTMDWAQHVQTDFSILHLSLVHSAASLRLCDQGVGDMRETLRVVKVERTAPDWYGPVRIARAPGLGTTAYLISKEAMKSLTSGKQPDIPIDDLLAAAHHTL